MSKLEPRLPKPYEVEKLEASLNTLIHQLQKMRDEMRRMAPWAYQQSIERWADQIDAMIAESRKG